MALGVIGIDTAIRKLKDKDFEVLIKEYQSKDQYGVYQKEYYREAKKRNGFDSVRACDSTEIGCKQKLIEGIEQRYPGTLKGD